MYEGSSNVVLESGGVQSIQEGSRWSQNQLNVSMDSSNVLLDPGGVQSVQEVSEGDVLAHEHGKTRSGRSYKLQIQ